MKQFKTWFEEAKQCILNPETVSLATIDALGRPALRHVFLKQYSDEGFIFYTNYHSNKSKNLELNQQIAMSFFWSKLERQVNIQGVAEKVNPKISNDYFLSRSRGSQISAWSSHQSCVISDRKKLEKNYQFESEKWQSKKMMCPPFWGGYLVRPTAIEFWQGREHRLHDRFIYKRSKNLAWEISRLSP